MSQNIQPQTNMIPLDDEKSHQTQALVHVESSKAVQEVQASLIIAKRFPRDEIASQRKIMNACQRPGLAEVATYEYSRGGSSITGPSIRLAEAIAQYWGNIDFGWRELERRAGVSTVQAYCWDKETNTRREMTFDVKHMRDNKQGGKVLKDERDIYENNANNAARRMRACILSLIPGDIVEDAVQQCSVTISTKEKITPETIKAMVDYLDKFGVNKAMIEARIQRNIDAITPAQMVKIRSICNSLKDGMGSIADFFDMTLAYPKTDPIANPEQGTPQSKKNTEEENKSNLEAFKEKHVSSEKKTTMEDKLVRAENAATVSKQKPAPVQHSVGTHLDCKSCFGSGVIHKEDGKEPCRDCGGTGKAS